MVEFNAPWNPQADPTGLLRALLGQGGPTPTLRAAPQMSPDQIRMQREMAMSLMKPATQPMLSKWQGAANVMEKAMAGLEYRQANEAEQAGRQQAATAFGDLLKPYLGGNNAMPSAAPSNPASSPQSTGGTDTAPTTQTASAAPPDDLLGFIRGHEGFSATPYADGAQTSIGYGTKARPGDTNISRDEAEQRLQGEVGEASKSVDAFAPNAPQNIKNALTDLTYNTGPGWQQSGLGQAVKSQNWPQAKAIFTQYVHADGNVEPGLVARRNAMAGAFDQPGAQPQSGMPSTALAFNGQPASAGLTGTGTSLPAVGATPGGIQASPASPPPGVPPTPSNAPAATAGIPGGMPQPLTSPVANIDPQKLQATLASPFISPAEKQYLIQSIVSRSEVKSMPVEGGTLMYDGTGRRQFIPEPKYSEMDLGGGMKIPTVGRFDPQTRQWNWTYSVPQMAGAPGSPSGAPQAPTAPKTPAQLDIGQPGTPGTPDQMKNFVDQTPGAFPKLPQSGNINDLTKYTVDKEAYKDSAKGFQDVLNKKAESGRDARDNSRSLDLLDKVLNDPRVVTGFAQKKITNLDQALNLLGLSKGDRAAVSAVAEKLGSGEITKQIRETNIGQGVAVRATEANAIYNSNFDLSKPLEANRAVVQLMKKAEDRIVEDAEFANMYADKHGRLDNGYYSARDKWFAMHPLFSDEELANQNQVNQLMGRPATPAAPATTPALRRSKDTDPFGLKGGGATSDPFGIR